MLNKIGVVGAGKMGHSIAEAFAIHGYIVNLYEPYEKVRNSVKDLISKELRLFVKEELLKETEIPEILSRIILFDDMKESMEDRDYVIEATPEQIDSKQDVFAKLDEICLPETIISSNTSSLKLMEIAQKMPPERKERIMICHWFNPGHIMPMVELSFFGNMSNENYNKVHDLYESIEKQPVKVLKDIPGLLSSRIQQAIAREVYSLVEMGVADPEDIDRALVFGPAFRYATTGQLKIADMGGLDIWNNLGDSLLSVMDNNRQANEIIKNKVKEGKLGFKTGEGFFQYKENEKEVILEDYMKKLIHQLKVSKKYTK